MQGRVVVVTGGFGVLGRAVAEAAQAKDAKVARVDIAPPPATAGEGDLGGVDIVDASSAAAAVQMIVERFGGLDVLVNIAGGFTWTTLQAGGADAYARMFPINLATTSTMTTAAGTLEAARRENRQHRRGRFSEGRRRHGRLRRLQGRGGAVTESLAEELKDRDITVNAVLPLIIDTPTNRAEMPNADRLEWVKPSSVAEVILFLASPAAAAISGALIPVTRGG